MPVVLHTRLGRVRRRMVALARVRALVVLLAGSSVDQGFGAVSQVDQ
jgi:hypothetical protein